MNPGALRHLVTVERPVTSQSESGEELSTYALVCKSFASIEPIGGSEALEANQITAELDTRITLRWEPKLDAISAKWRVTFGGTVYDIKRPAHFRLERRVVELTCSSGLHQS